MVIEKIALVIVIVLDAIVIGTSILFSNTKCQGEKKKRKRAKFKAIVIVIVIVIEA